MPKIIDGKVISAAAKDAVREEVAKLKEKGIETCLAVIIVGDDPASKIYVANKEKACEYTGIESRKYALPAETKMEELLALIDKLKKEIPDILLTTDIIVGFPGETEEDFEHTLDVVRKVGYSSAFTFIYSKRTGTPAAEYEDQIPEDVTKNRFNRLLTLVNNMVHDVNEKFIGHTMPVLVEEESKNSKNMVTGRTPNNLLVHFEGDASLIGTVVDVKLTENKSFYIIGERN